MHPALVGTLLGVANVMISGVLIGLQQRAPEAAGVVIALGLLPAILAGMLIGLLAGALSRWRVAARIVLLVVPCMLIVAALGAGIGAVDFIPCAEFPTIFLCLVLERRTRNWERVSSDGEPGPSGPSGPVTPIRLAMVLGALLALIAMAGCFAGREHGAAWFWQGYLPWGLLVGSVLGAPFGGLAIWLVDEPPWARRLTLLTTVWLLIAAVASMAGPRAYELLLMTAIPASAACLVLERHSRKPEAIPTARAFVV